MNDVLTNDRRIMNRRRILTNIIIGYILLSGIVYYMRLPVEMAGWLVPFEVETPYIPIEVEEQYSKFVGFDRVKLVYENNEQKITVWATTEKGWIHTSSFEEKVTFKAGNGYYTEDEREQLLAFKMQDVEYLIEYNGRELLTEEELFSIATSILIIQFAIGRG